MTLQERGRLANQAYSMRAAERARAVRDLQSEGVCLKRAAHAAGVSYRTAKRYRAALRGRA